MFCDCAVIKLRWHVGVLSTHCRCALNLYRQQTLLRYSTHSADVLIPLQVRERSNFKVQKGHFLLYRGPFLMYILHLLI